MGWTYSSAWPTKKAMVQHVTSHELLGDKLKLVTSCSRGSTVWAVIEYTEASGMYPIGHRAILCFLLGAQKNYGWGYKDMDESMGPCDLSCPVSYLDMVPDPGSYATEWRAKVRAKAAKRAVKIGLGDTIVLSEGCRPPSLTCTSLKPLRAISNGVTYRIKRGLIERIEKAMVTA